VLRPGCHRQGMSVSMATATVKQSSLLSIVEARLYVLAGQKRWVEARQAIRHGLAVSNSMDSYIEDRLLALADGLPKNGF
jgi:hypothetical protein